MSSRSLKAVSLVTLTMQNSMLTILLHYSRINVAPTEMYSAASAVLLNELLKLCVSFCVSTYSAVEAQGPYASLEDESNEKRRSSGPSESWRDVWTGPRIRKALSKIQHDVFSSDCWKLAIPACLYVIQNNLQFVAASNLDVPTFQVTYNLKILTTAVFSVIMLKRKLSGKKWIALTLLAIGVGVVQLQSTAAAGSSSSSNHGVEMNKFKGLLAVFSACITSGIAGVYFEMVLKGSKADLWIRNIQLSIFSLIPAFLPVLLPRLSYAFSSDHGVAPPPPVFAYFGFWAWSVVLCQVVGGLVTALVIKYADNLLKGFATSLAIILSFLAGVVLFHFNVTFSFLLGTVIVVGATVLYNQPDPRPDLIPKAQTPAPIYGGLAQQTSSASFSNPSAASSFNGHMSPPLSRSSRPTSPILGLAPSALQRRPPGSGVLTPEVMSPQIDSHGVEMPLDTHLGNGSVLHGRKGSLVHPESR
ncbi:nucleotide-sugar transporter [Meredithblackwellia eburnea MCA 4105]